MIIFCFFVYIRSNRVGERSMAIVVNIIGKGSNVGKTVLIECLIQELVKRGYHVATIKHDVHGFEIDHRGKDTYRHRMAGAETVIISSSNQMAYIKQVEEEISVEELIQQALEKDIILVEGYKRSSLRKIEVIGECEPMKVITPREQLIAIAANSKEVLDGIPVVQKNDVETLIALILQEKEYSS